MSDVSRHQYQNVRGDAKLLLATVHLLFHLSLPNNMRTKFKFLHYFDFFEKIHSISVGCMAKQPFDCHLNFNLFTLSIFISKLHKQSCFCLNRAAPQCFGWCGITELPLHFVSFRLIIMILNKKRITLQYAVKYFGKCSLSQLPVFVYFHLGCFHDPRISKKNFKCNLFQWMFSFTLLSLDRLNIRSVLHDLWKLTSHYLNNLISYLIRVLKKGNLRLYV